MSLEDIRRECSDAAKLLQPYIDGELTGEEHEKVADHLGGCGACRTAVREQQWVRTSLQSIERERAPAELRERIVLELDGIDRKRDEAVRNAFIPGLARAIARVRDLFRGGMIMIPAGAVAVALFVAARQGWLPGEPFADGVQSADSRITLPSSNGPDATVLDSLAQLQPQVDFPVQVANSQGGTQLVGAGLDHPSGERPTSFWARYRIRRPAGDDTRVIDRQVPAELLRKVGEPRQSDGGLTYYVHRDDRGLPVVSFQVGDVAHLLTVEGGDTQPGGATLPVLAEGVLVRLADHLNRTAANTAGQ